MTLKNILFLIANDQRFDTIHALGNQEIQTTNLDKLIEGGLSIGQYQGRFGISSWERLLGSFCPSRRGVAS